MELSAPATPAPIATSPSDAPRRQLEHFPIALFSMVMGAAGLAIAWLKAHAVLGMPVMVGEGLRSAASVLFVLLLGFYSLKALRYPQAVKLEMRHPIRIDFSSCKFSCDFERRVGRSQRTPLSRIKGLDEADILAQAANHRHHRKIYRRGNLYARVNG